MMKQAATAVAILLVWGSSSHAAPPEQGTREADIACAGLLGIANHGVQTAGMQNSAVGAATLGAYSLYLGRLSLREPRVTTSDVARVVNDIKAEDRGPYVTACLKGANEMLARYSPR